MTVPTLPGCITYGANLTEAISMAREAIELYVESLFAHGEEIPTEARWLLHYENDAGLCYR